MLSRSAFVWSAVLAAAPATADVGLVRDGRPLASIVLPADPMPEETCAAERLQHYIGRMTGAELPIIAEGPQSAAPAVFIGRTAFSETIRPRLDAHRPPAEASLTVVEGAAVCMVGVDPIGTLHGVYFLLEELGCAWYFPADWGTVVPSASSVSLVDGERYHAPDFRIRAGLTGITAGIDDDPAWAPLEWGRGNHLGGWRWWGAGHSYQYLVDFAEFANHPEWFALVNGERKPTQLCTTNPEVRQRALQTVLGVLSKPDAPELICVSPCDNNDFCDCDNCKRLIAADGGSIDRIVEFANSIADAIRGDYPDHYVTYYCDYHSVGAPTLVTPAPNTVFWITQWAQDQFHGVGPETRMGQSLERWGRFGNPIFLYTYYGSYGSWTFWPQAHAIRKDMAYYKEHGAIGVYSETHAHWGSQHLNFIVFPRLAWDVDADVDAIIDRFCRDFYGPAAEPMRSYYDLLETAGERGPAQYHLHSDIVAMVTPELLTRLRDLIGQATELAAADADPVFAQRMEFVSAGFRQADAYLTAQHLKAEHGQSRDPAIRERMASLYRDALAIVTDARYAERLTENWLSEATLRRELEAIERGATFPPGQFSYSDYLTRGGNSALDAARKAGFSDGVWGLDLPAGGAGELVYELRAREGTLGEARLTTLVFGAQLIGARIEVADTLEGPWQVVAAHEDPTAGKPSGITLPVDLTDAARGKPAVLVRVVLTNRGPEWSCALCNIGFEGRVEAR